MGMGAKLKSIIDSRGIKVTDLAEGIGVNPTTLYSFLNRDSDGIKLSVFFKICEYLKISPESLNHNNYSDITSYVPSEFEVSMLKKYHYLDQHGKRIVDFNLNEEYTRCIEAKSTIYKKTNASVYKLKHSTYKVSAGTGYMLSDSDSWDTIEVPDTPETRRADFALTIQGDSMEPIYFDGDVVIVKRQEEIGIGEVGIFVVNGEGYIKKNGGDRLISLNSAYRDIKFSESDTIMCVGKVIGRV